MIMSGPIGVRRRYSSPIAAAGYGFVEPERGLEQGAGDIYIAGQHLSEAMHGDRVVVRIERVKDGGRAEGRIIRILERANTWLVGRYDRDEQGMGFVVPFDRRILSDTRIKKGVQDSIITGSSYVGYFLAGVFALSAAGVDFSSLALIAGVALTSNLFVAPASYFQNNYLDKVRHYSGGGIALFTTLTVTPASVGLIVGGRLADVVGRRRLIAWCTPASTALLVLGFWVGGPLMWLTALGGGILAGMAYPAMQVYRTELFPTGNRGVANAITTTTALVSGSVGILIVGVLRDHGWSYGKVMALLAVGQVLAVLIAWIWYPETAHLELEAINPDDPAIDD